MHKLITISFITTALIGIFIWKVSNFTGYCKEAGRVLTKEELIEKIAGKDTYKQNPYCCLVSEGGWLAGDFEIFFDKLTGFYNYQIYRYYRRENPTESNNSYYESYVITNECGRYITSYEISASEKEYQRFINSNKKYSKKKGE